jgi:HPt (histidine-containing phosphotransfer) domain-containing protein
MKGDRERFLRAGMDDYVSKPVENHDLYEVIRRVMTGKTKKEKPAEKTEDAGGGSFDLESLKARYEGHEELFKNMVSMFLQQAPEELDKLQRALDHSDLAGAAKASHGLVGMCSVFGKTKLIEYGSELEETAHNNDAENAVALFQKLREEMSSVLAVLSREVER